MCVSSWRHIEVIWLLGFKTAPVLSFFFAALLKVSDVFLARLMEADDLPNNQLAKAEKYRKCHKHCTFIWVHVSKHENREQKDVCVRNKKAIQPTQKQKQKKLHECF